MKVYFHDLGISIPFWDPQNLWDIFLNAAILSNSKYSEIKENSAY